jgi:hypothetical protein
VKVGVSLFSIELIYEMVFKGSQRPFARLCHQTRAHLQAATIALAVALHVGLVA